MRFNGFVSFFEVLALGAESEVAACEECWKFIRPYPVSECDGPPTVLSPDDLAETLRVFFGIFDVVREVTWFSVTSSTNGQRERSEQL